MDASGRTERGCERMFTDDQQYLIADLDRRMLIRQSSLPLGVQPRWRACTQGKLLLVADGMGGGEASQMASRTMLDAVIQYIVSVMPWIATTSSLPGEHRDERDNERILDDLGYVIARCANRLREVAGVKDLRDSLGSAMTLAYVTWPDLYVVHAGDSRCYLHRAGRLYQLTSDHSEIAALDEQAAPESARPWRRRQRVKDACGSACKETRAEVHHVSLHEEDRLLLCTQELHRHLGHEEIARCLSADLLSASACERLAQAARSAGATDNITAVVCRFG